MAPVSEMEAPITEHIPTNIKILCSDEVCGAQDEKRFVWYQKEVEDKTLEELKFAKRLDAHNEEYTAEHLKPAFDKKKDFKDKFRCGGAKGKTGSTDFTRGKNAFVRPCTVGWKSQNQPLMKGGGPRTPRQKG